MVKQHLFYNKLTTIKQCYKQLIKRITSGIFKIFNVMASTVPYRPVSLHFNCELFFSLGKNVFHDWNWLLHGHAIKENPNWKCEILSWWYIIRCENSRSMLVSLSHIINVPTGEFGLVIVLSLSYNRWYHHTRSGNHRTLAISYRFLHPPYFNVSGCPRVQSIDRVRNLSSVTLLTKLETAR